ncbi:MAG: ABC transporter ATP-binding protein [Hormoscilla sp. SP5CHS1]|nr:ABC transporter ATP-binding protein [Hormoscilla sp. SP12CHS1]MBC6453793.1 ABC transporter ATP-binding protein [Hormoscilla sp. SP5CHS1]
MEKPVIVQIEGVTRQFDKSTLPAVDKMTLSLQRSDILGLLGPSGCGKTTLLRLVAGFEQPQAGYVALAGRPVAGGGYWVPPEKRDVGIVFQDYALFPHLTVAQNIAFGLQQGRLKKSSTVRGRPEKSVQTRVNEVLALVGLEGLQKRYPHQLSGGQQQRVALARALAPAPALILLDEPLSNLDVQVRLRLREEIRKILKTSGTTGIFVTHDREEAMAIADWVGVMRQGRLEQLGTPEEVYQQPGTRFVAEFVTQANFIPARRRGQLWETEVGSFEVKTVREADFDIGDLMIRQEDLILKPDEEGKVAIADRQFLGREYHYSLVTASGRQLKARATGSSPLSVGTKVKLAIAKGTLEVFRGL